MEKTKTYAKAILIPVVVGGIVGLFISNSIDYNSLQKPHFSPPSIIFPIVWTILYILMGISYGILKNKSLTNSRVNAIYYIQLLANAIWPISFFVLKWRLFSFIWIVLLCIIVLIMVMEFYKQNKLSGLLQIPYLLWTLYATYLNLFIYLLNRR